MRERFTTEQLQIITEDAIRWINSTREEHKPTASPITKEERDVLVSFFGEELIDRIRVKEVEKIATSSPVLPEGNFTGFTFVDTILLTERNPLILAHEGVHVVQYEVLGVRGLVETFIRQGLQCGFNYWSIPVERQAFDISMDFSRNPSQPFSVPDRVKRELAEMIK